MSKFYSAETQQGHSSHFFRYIKHVAEATSTQEKDEHIEADLKELKTSLATLSSSSASSTSRGTDDDLLKEYAVRAYYAEMLGHSAEFAYIHCINLACSHRLLHKRTGYLATGLMVHPDSELMYLMVATIQRDLKSPNYLEVAAALTAAARMLRPELMTMIHGELAGLLLHEKPLVRRKAVEAMHALYLRSDTAVGDTASFRQALCDRDPSVMDAATRLLQDVVLRDPASQRDLLDSFVFVLSQVMERRLPRAYEYHRMPAPWLQIRVIQVLTLLIGDDARLAEKASHILSEAMQRADNGKLIGFAVVCEVVRTAASIPPQPGLLDLAAEAVSGLITARNPNLRCAGIQALSYVVRVNPELAVQHQEVVMQCLEDADETIRRKTIWLLFAICDRDNIAPIARRLVQFLGRVGDPFLKRSTTRGLCRLMEQHASDPWWYIRTMNRVLAVAPECVLPATVQRMLKLIAEGQGADEAADTAFRVRCVEAYVAITGGSGGGRPGREMTSDEDDEDEEEGEGDASAESRAGASAPTHAVPDVLRRIGAWVMGEYGFLASRVSSEMLLDRLCDLMEQTTDGETRCWILTSLSKVAAAQLQQPSGSVPDYVVDLVKQFQDSRCIPLQQRCYELGELLKSPPVLLRRVMPLDGFCEEMQPDKALGFLDEYVAAAATRGARAYAQPPGIAALQSRLAATSVSGAALVSDLRTAAYVPTRAMDVRPVWSAAFATSATAAPGAEASAGGPHVTHGDPAALPALNAGLAQSVLPQGSERLVLHPTATKRWGAPNVREAAAAAEEVHLQASAAAAVGGSGVVWGAETVLDASVPEPPGSAVDAVVPAFREGRGAVTTGAASDADPRAGNRQTASAAMPKPVSAKNAKFVRSIFGGGRRSSNSGAVREEKSAPAISATAGTASPAQPLAPTRDQCASGTVMDSLFAKNVSPAAATSPSSSAAWFPEGAAPAAAHAPPSTTLPASAAVPTPWQPVDASFTTARFEQAWKALGSAGECSRALVLSDLSDAGAPSSVLQHHLLRRASLRVVDAIGKELIAAATQGAGAQAEYVLAHATVASSTTVTVTVRAARREVSEGFMQRLQAA